MYLVPPEHFAQCRATQQVFYKLFTLKTIPNLQLKCTLYVVHFLPVLDFMAALNPSIVSVELHASRETGFTFVFFFVIVFVLCLVCLMLPVSLDFP